MNRDTECHFDDLVEMTMGLMEAISQELKLKQIDCFGFVKAMACIACGIPKSTPHHLKSQGSGGPNTIDNLLPLCSLHHDQIHRTGLKQFLEDFPQVKIYLKVVGSEYA